jgi:chromosome segregation ATPase
LNALLKLKRVELQGFKSFCERTELRFNGEGIAGIVGPNGCGKSNISDAISWVLGEQSAKSLRGARMEDVIFAGTRDRKPLGMAYVTMTLVDPEHYRENHAHKPVPVEEGQPKKNSEVTITRRLYRSGESEYLIDGRPARLRDIQDIFMGTGLGPESYAIIEQGRIGQILSSKTAAPSSKRPPASPNSRPASASPKPSSKAPSRTSPACTTSWKRSIARSIPSSAKPPRPSDMANSRSNSKRGSA